ncbi:outer membrane lipoprotein [Roseateles koreensis]|uniref:Glycine zipper 2TM domain-containing protein n=1 Tax=Roseateles koreensis TaxID=2987526 RepID=A0ABT5KRH4_9BURK|nr:glycine zipper 2TM domain-containing protein [Roseateles koreensis]MDC8785514.1 glycine zipper 2TM domain-containing protein [Roseateles koreensis]
MKKIILSTTLVALATLSACSTTSPDVIKREDAQRMAQIQDATVLSVRTVTVDGSQSGIGAVAGGVVGGIAGSSVGGQRENAIVGVLGAVAGAVAGNAVERATTREDAVEIIVQLRNGERRSVVQAKGQENLQPGEAVILVTTGGKTRVSRAPAVTAAPMNEPAPRKY